MSKIFQLGCIKNTRETHRNAQERTGAQGEDVIISDKGHCKFPVNAQTNTHLLYAIVVAAVIFSCAVAAEIF